MPNEQVQCTNQQAQMFPLRVRALVRGRQALVVDVHSLKMA